jgi:hypothetical protein
MSLRLYHSPGCWVHWCTKCGECIEARVKSKLLRRMRKHQCGNINALMGQLADQQRAYVSDILTLRRPKTRGPIRVCKGKY